MIPHIDLREFDRIIIVGSGGAGKSYFAKLLAEKTGHPLFHLDNEYWRPGWVKPPREEWVARQHELIAGERWIIEGNYNSTMELRFAAAELVILLDINRLVACGARRAERAKNAPTCPITSMNRAFSTVNSLSFANGYGNTRTQDVKRCSGCTKSTRRCGFYV